MSMLDLGPALSTNRCNSWLFDLLMTTMQAGALVPRPGLVQRRVVWCQSYRPAAAPQKPAPGFVCSALGHCCSCPSTAGMASPASRCCSRNSRYSANINYFLTSPTLSPTSGGASGNLPFDLRQNWTRAVSVTDKCVIYFVRVLEQ